jgi:epoxyqueuosine reductase
MYLNNAISKILKPYQNDYLGFADLSNYQDEIFKSGGPIVQGYKCGISIGIILQNSIVDYLTNRFENNVACEYRIHAYEVINQRLNIMASVISTFLNRKGYKALPIAAADRTDDDKATASISHKMIAHIAGLGWIGKNCLLITNDHGPRVRFISILTNAPLKKNDKPIEQRCNDCNECEKVCPTKSIKGRNYIQGETREERFDFLKCQNYFDKLKETQKYQVCGMCLYACPYGKRNQ